VIPEQTKLVYFSPTETTKKIVEGIARGVESKRVEHLDLTPPDARTRVFHEMHDELVLVGAPVYGGRIPIDAVRRLKRLKGNNTPAAIVVVYGNRAYEDALLELRDIVKSIGFQAIAGAAFIGEHSFSTAEMPLAAARPDGTDLLDAVEFGHLLREKLAKMSGVDHPTLAVPGNFPYRERGEPSGITPITDETLCGKCETCVAVCPAAAITAIDRIETDPTACILCCACVKNCPTGARVLENERIRRTMEWLYEHHSERKEPEMFL